MSITNSATRAIEIVRDVEYKPEWIYANRTLGAEVGATANGAGMYDKAPIYAIHVVANGLTAGTHFIRMWFYDQSDDNYVDMDSGGFLVGHIYPIYLRKFTIVNASGTPVTDQDANYSMIGYQAKNMPYELT